MSHLYMGSRFGFLSEDLHRAIVLSAWSRCGMNKSWYKRHGSRHDGVCRDCVVILQTSKVYAIEMYNC